MTSADIIETAAMQLAVDETPNDADLLAHFDAALGRIQDNGDRVCLVMASKLLAGKPYGIHTDNPKTVRRACSIAADLGADVDAIAADSGSTVLRFTPPIKN